MIDAAVDLGPVDDADGVVVDVGAGLVGPASSRAPDRIDGEQLDDPAGQPGLLVELAQRGGFGMLAELDAAAGQRPRARAPR